MRRVCVCSLLRNRRQIKYWYNILFAAYIFVGPMRCKTPLGSMDPTRRKPEPHTTQVSGVVYNNWKSRASSRRLRPIKYILTSKDVFYLPRWSETRVEGRKKIYIFFYWSRVAEQVVYDERKNTWKHECFSGIFEQEKRNRGDRSTLFFFLVPVVVHLLASRRLEPIKYILTSKDVFYLLKPKK